MESPLFQNPKDKTVCDLIKTQLCCLGITLSLLLGFTLYPPISSGGIDPQRSTWHSGPASTLLDKNNAQRLIGTAVSMKDSADNFAVIEDTGKEKQWIYREGDLVGELLIKKILPDRMIVDGGKGEVVLKLRRSLIETVAGTTPVMVDKSTPPFAAKLLNRAGSRSRHYVVNGNVVAAAFVDPKRLLDTVNMHYVDRTPRNTGIRIGSFGPDSVFASMGLRKGDLLTGINNQPITGTDDAVAMLQAMLTDGQAELKVRRRARTYRFHLQTE